MGRPGHQVDKAPLVGAMVKGEQAIVVEPVQGDHGEPAQGNPVNVHGLRIDRRLGGDPQSGPEPVQSSRLAQSSPDRSSASTAPRSRDVAFPDRDLPEAATPAQERHRGLGPDLAHEVCRLLSIEPLPLLLGQLGRKVPVPRQRVLGAIDLADDLGSRMCRGNGLAGQRGESIDQPVQPAVVVGLEHHGLWADQDIRLNLRHVLSCQTGPGLDPGRSSQWKQATSGDSSSSGSRAGPRPSRSSESLRGPSASASRSRSGQLSRTCSIGSLSVDSSIIWQTHGQIDGLGRGTGPVDPAAEGRPGRGVVAQPEPAEPEILVRCLSRNGVGGEQIKGRGGRAPEPFLGPAQSPGRIALAGPRRGARAPRRANRTASARVR